MLECLCKNITLLFSGNYLFCLRFIEFLLFEHCILFFFSERTAKRARFIRLYHISYLHKQNIPPIIIFGMNELLISFVFILLTN